MDIKAEMPDWLNDIVYRLKQAHLMLSVDDIGRLQLSESLKDFLLEIVRYSHNDQSLPPGPRFLDEMMALGVKEIEEINSAVEVVIGSQNQKYTTQYVTNQFNFFPPLPSVVPTGGFTNIFGLPPVVSGFTGRESELLQLSNNIGQLQVVTQKIAGVGGIGKSQLANHFARAKLKEGFYQWVVWLTVGLEEETQKKSNQDVPLTQTNISSRIASLGRMIGLKVEGYLDSELISIIYHVMCKKGLGLIVFDDVESYQQIKMLLPETFGVENVHVLITSRNSLVWGNDVGRIQLGVFFEDEAVMYMGKAMSPSKFDAANARVLVVLLGKFPLALSQAVAYIENNPITIAEYIALFNKTRENKKKLLNSLPLPQDEHQTSVWTTVQMSLKMINNSTALTVLRIFSHCLPETPMDAAFLKCCVESEFEANGCVEILARYSLIRESSIENHFEMHQLVQQCVLLDVDPAKTRADIIYISKKTGDFLGALEKLPQRVGHTIHLDHFIKYLDKLVRVEMVNSERSKLYEMFLFSRFSILELCRGYLFYRRGIYFKGRGEHVPAIFSFKQAICNMQVANVTTEFIPLCEFYIGSLFLEANDVERAIDYLKFSLKSFNAFRFKSEVVDCEIMLGRAYASAGRFGNALNHYVRAMEMCSAVSKVDIRIAGCQKAMGLIYSHCSDNFRSKFYLELALKEYDRNNRSYYMDVIIILVYLGGVCLELGELEGVAHYHASLELMQKVIKYKDLEGNRSYFDDYSNRIEFQRFFILIDKIMHYLAYYENKIINDASKGGGSSFLGDVRKCVDLGARTFSVLTRILLAIVGSAELGKFSGSDFFTKMCFSGEERFSVNFCLRDEERKINLLKISVKFNTVRELIFLRFPALRESCVTFPYSGDEIRGFKRELMFSRLNERYNYIYERSERQEMQKYQAKKYSNHRDYLKRLLFPYTLLLHFMLLMFVFVYSDQPWYMFSLTLFLQSGFYWYIFFVHLFIMNELPKLGLIEYEEEEECVYHNSLYYFVPPIAVGVTSILYQLDSISTFSMGLLSSVSAAVSLPSSYQFAKNMFRLFSRPTIKSYKDELVEDYRSYIAPCVAVDQLSDTRREVVNAIQFEEERYELFCRFHECAILGLVEELKVLIQLKIPIDCRDPREFRRGRSALHSAVENAHEECVKLLLMAGADPFWPDLDGQTPYDLALNKPNLMLLFKTVSESSLSIML